MFKIKDKIKKRNKSFFTKAKKGTKFEEEKYENQKESYDFYCPKCRTKFETNFYRFAVTINSLLNIITKHNCGIRCHRFIKPDYDIIERLFLKSNKTVRYYPEHKKIKDAYKKRNYIKKTKRYEKKEEFEV